MFNTKTEESEGLLKVPRNLRIPNGPKELSPSDILQRFIKANPRQSEPMEIGPAMAEAMLKLNVNNRPLSEASVKKYVARMKRGWVMTGETIIISNTGRLLNGQTRLHACIESGCTFPVHVVFGIDDEAFAVMDTGKTRTASDVFSINGVQNASLMSSSALWLWKYINTGMMQPMSWLMPTHDQLYEFYTQHEGLQESGKLGHKFSENSIGSPSLATALHFVCAAKNQALADDFFRQTATGIGFTTERQPAAKLRKRLIDERVGGSRLSDLYTGAFIVMTWNALRANRAAPLLRWRGEQQPDQPFPRAG